MNNSGTCLAVGVALLFSSACDEGKQPDDKSVTKPESASEATTKAKTDPATASATDEKMADMAKTTGDEVQCLGIHECKGKSDCHIVGGHACAGQNECKGKGWIKVPRAECETRGGKINES